MRTLQEIEQDIKAIEQKVQELKSQKSALDNEKRECLFSDFCEKYGVKKGDVVRTTKYGDFMIYGINTNWLWYINVCKIKKNGEPYSSTTSLTPECFEGCTVLRHIDEV
jgi:hypothetical protein